MSPASKLIPVVAALMLASCATLNQQPPPGPALPTQPPMVRQNPMLQTPIPAPSDKIVREAPSGSLWSPSDSSLYRDLRASKVGDVVTITVSEQSTGSRQAATTTSRTKTFDGSFKFGGAGMGAAAAATTPANSINFGPYNGSFDNGFTGSGSTNRTDSMSAYMTASVVDILPNGNLVIRGSRWTKLNDDMQQIVLEGVVRPVDITRNNTVLSQNIAEAKIFLVGKGPIAQQQKPGWLGRLMDILTPF